MSTAIKSFILCAVVLAIGVVIRFGLLSMKEAPAAVELPEESIGVTAKAIEPESVQIMIPGLGPARPLDEVGIAPEIAGTVSEVHPNLDVGGIIPEGETIFAIDPSTYTARRDEAAATVEQWTSQLEELRKQFEIDQRRLETLKRSRELAKQEFERRKALLENDEVGSRSDVDAQERAYNAAIDAADQLGQAVELYPMRIAQAEASLESAKARLELAAIDVRRTNLTAPFTARVTSKRVEVGQYVAPGTEWVTIADDSLLEISIPINADYARNWIRFNDELTPDDVAWFSAVEPVDCEIRWTEVDPTEQCWIGQLHRVGKYDEMSRQVNLVVRVPGEEAARTGPNGLPLVAGMFCSVKIPGKTVDGVYRIPDGLLSHEETIYMAVEGRLRTVQMEEIHREDDEVIVRGDLPDGALLITTRLTNPLENILLDIVREDEEGAE